MVRVAALLVVLGLAAACSSSSESTDTATLPLRTCGLTIWHKPASKEAHVEIVGDFNDWKRPGIEPRARDDGWRVASIEAAAGEHAYAIVEDGVWKADDNQALSGTHDGRDVSIATAANCDQPMIRVDSVETTPAGDATVHATFVSARDGKRMIPASLTATGRDGDPLPITSFDEATGKLTFATSGLKRGKYTYTLAASDTGGRSAEDARATVWIDARSGSKDVWDPRDAVVYQVVLDRYRDAKGPLAPPANAAARAGGNLAGVKQALDSGELEALGVTALWLSPLYRNPTGEFAGNDGHMFTSYHGYWPIASRALDDRFATEKELDAFVADAHGRGIRVIYDVVPNHVHAQHPYAQKHKDWFNPAGCVCGQNGCAWGETCWFAPYLPDFDWNQEEPAKAETEDVMWWFDRFDADGIRIDAVPMMPRGATRRIAASARQRYAHPGNELYVLGENFTGPGGYQSLKYDLGPYGLDGAFHFPLMWTLRESIAHEFQPMSAIDETFHAGETAWKGAGAVMGLMIGNHDVSRFSSESAGNATGDTWVAPLQSIDPQVYAKQRLALAAVLTMPGAPVLYYGDEVGLAGRSDPDCRRVMPADDALNAAQVKTRDFTRKVGQTRSCSRALRRGALTTVLADGERYVFTRTDDEGETAVVVLTRRPTGPTTVTLPPGAPTSLVDVVTGEHVDAAGGALKIDADPLVAHVYLSTGDPCSPH